MVGLQDKVVKVSQKVGLIVTHVELIKILVEKNVNPVVDKKVKQDLNTQDVDQHRHNVKVIKDLTKDEKFN
jgi:predicted secreted protein